MPKYVVLTNWTDQGIKNIADSPARLEAAKALAKSMGCEFRKFYMTAGAFDMVIVFQAPDDDTMAKFALALAKGGNIRTTTLKAFSEDAYRAIVAAVK